MHSLCFEVSDFCHFIDDDDCFNITFFSLRRILISEMIRVKEGVIPPFVSEKRTKIPFDKLDRKLQLKVESKVFFPLSLMKKQEGSYKLKQFVWDQNDSFGMQPLLLLLLLLLLMLPPLWTMHTNKEMELQAILIEHSINWRTMEWWYEYIGAKKLIEPFKMNPSLGRCRANTSYSVFHTSIPIFTGYKQMWAQNP